MRTWVVRCGRRVFGLFEPDEQRLFKHPPPANTRVGQSMGRFSSSNSTNRHTVTVRVFCILEVVILLIDSIGIPEFLQSPEPIRSLELVSATWYGLLTRHEDFNTDGAPSSLELHVSHTELQLASTTIRHPFSPLPGIHLFSACKSHAFRFEIDLMIPRTFQQNLPFD